MDYNIDYNIDYNNIDITPVDYNNPIDYHKEIGIFKYKALLTRIGKTNTDLQPFSKGMTFFCHLYGMYAPFTKAVIAWHTGSFKQKKITLEKLFKKFITMPPGRCRTRIESKSYHFLQLRNACIREVISKLIIIDIRWKHAYDNHKLHEYLEKTGLGRYFRNMQKAGDIYDSKHIKTKTKTRR